MGHRLRSGYGSYPANGDATYGKFGRNALSFASTPSPSRLFGATLNAGVNGVAPASARTSMSTTSSPRRRPFGNPSSWPASRPRRFGDADGGIATFRRIISDGRTCAG